MSIWVLYVKKNYGGPKPTWRICTGIIPKGKVQTSIRKVTNRKLKSRLMFAGTELKPY